MKETTAVVRGSTRRLIPVILVAVLVCYPAFADDTAAPVSNDSVGVLPDNNLEKMREIFNQYEGKVRMLIILSPDCSHCQDGAREVREKVLDKISSEKLQAFVVWIPLLPDDSYELATESRKLLADPRVLHYWQNDWTLGNEFGKILELPKDYQYTLAIDVFMVFDDQAQWTDDLPKPIFWMHKLGEDQRTLNGDELFLSVEQALLLAETRRQ